MRNLYAFSRTISSALILSLCFILFRADKTNLVEKTNILNAKMFKSNAVQYILLWTQIRSGSRFVGDIITLNFDVYYIEEPLADLYMSQTPNVKQVNVSTFLKDILNCDHHLHPGYYARKMQFTHMNNKDLFQLKGEGKIAVDDIAEIDTSLCVASRNRLGRVVIPTLDVVQPLFDDPNIDISLIMLIRDPRGIWRSRKGVQKPGEATVHKNDPCLKQSQDLKSLNKLKEKHANQIFVLRYEDLSLHPVAEAKRLYKFLGFPFTSITKNFIEVHTQFLHKESSLYSTEKRSSETVFNWRFHLEYEEMKRLQDRCGDILEQMNYTIFKSKEDYKNLTLSPLVT